MSRYKILIADDEEQMLLLLSSYLESSGFAITTAGNGKEVLDLYHQQVFDLVVLDIMMPEVDGFTVCKKIREKSNVPIIMLTAKSEELDRIHGLKIGADDYIVKPFSPKELVARVEALLRRSLNYNQRQDVISIGDLVVDLVGHKVTVNGKIINLTRKEFNLLEFFIHHKGQVFAREQLLDRIWGLESTGTLRTVDTHIKTLRLKLDTASDYIKTVWGVGYKFEV
ncbi:response regulator transcription factor [Aquibacillus koreensis]|uniref:Response regulator transcription factor n=1 Tax=Aquibacillus koreensis TaxID=279446 RepID=A0A9X3WGG7_9BACI|nr:response regulator transcription factor [Aquibacillus koreensis]MCT2536500.1 response regulator transcription factor [Aquibacillus koreensis]MDC3419412.1 response regulator transcription factor [Aquibacillus koreensis]